MPQSRLHLALSTTITLAIANAAIAQGADNCADAEFIKGYGTYSFSTVGATTDGAADVLCNFFSNQNIYNDVWFRFRAPETFVVDVASCAQTTLDTKIAVYGGPDCSAPVIACIDDNCSTQSRTTFTTQAGSEYLIRVGSYYNTTTTGMGSGAIVISPIALLGDVTNKVTGRRYVAVSATTWTAAEALGVSLGGHLVSISDAEEQDFVWQNFRNIGGIDRRIWIGFSDINVEGSYEWSDGTPAKYTNWNAGEPNNSGGVEDFAEMLGSSGKWNDLNDAGSGYAHIAVIELDAGGGGGGGEPCPADLDVDGAVTASDLSLLLATWGDPSGGADVNGDGFVDAADLSLLLAAWGDCPQ